MKVNKPDMSGRSLGRSSSSLLGGSKGSSAASAGSPILEVFVRPQAATGPGAQRYLHQAVSLRLPTMEEVSGGLHLR